MDTNDHTTERERAHAMGVFFKALKEEGFDEEQAVMLTAQAYEIGHLQPRPKG